MLSVVMLSGIMLSEVILNISTIFDTKNFDTIALSFSLSLSLSLSFYSEFLYGLPFQSCPQ
jgi:hypothetical protein